MWNITGIYLAVTQCGSDEWLDTEHINWKEEKTLENCRQKKKLLCCMAIRIHRNYQNEAIENTQFHHFITHINFICNQSILQLLSNLKLVKARTQWVLIKWSIERLQCLVHFYLFLFFMIIHYVKPRMELHKNSSLFNSIWLKYLHERRTVIC